MQICVRSRKFFAHEVGSRKRSPTESKLEAIKDFPIPTNKTQLRAWQEMVGYYARYVKNYATIAAPLTHALKRKRKNPKKRKEKLKLKLMSSAVLYAPNFMQKFIVHVSLYGARIVSSQITEGEEHPILYLSKTSCRLEQNYSTIERELVDIVYSVLKKLNYYLDGQIFEIQTDHNPPMYLKKMVGTNS